MEEVRRMVSAMIEVGGMMDFGWGMDTVEDSLTGDSLRLGSWHREVVENKSREGESESKKDTSADTRQGEDTQAGTLEVGRPLVEEVASAHRAWGDSHSLGT